VTNSFYQGKLTSAADAIAQVRSGDGIYIHSNAAAPRVLVSALCQRADAGELRDVNIYQIITLGDAPYTAPQYADNFTVHNLFVGHNTRQAVNEGRAHYVPLFFSDLTWMFHSGTARADVVLLQCSPPDADGNLTLGVSLDCTLAALRDARLVIAEINPRMPRTHGQTALHLSKVNNVVETEYELCELPNAPPGEVELAIGKRVAELVDDGATIQMGIGEIPNAVLMELRDKHDLGVHSEMFSDGVVDLVKAGVITGSRKTVMPGKSVVSFSMGSRRLYDFLHDNDSVAFMPSDFVNDPFTIAQNYKLTAINSALQVDLTGQVCADSIGTSMYSGCGGQVDFVRGAWRSEGGKAIIAMPATACGGKVSRIVPLLNPGAGVVTSRFDVQYVVTEYGTVNLRGLTMSQRVRALISIAASQFREELARQTAAFPWYCDKSAVRTASV
jgi:acetyl-CoA hydrolase